MRAITAIHAALTGLASGAMYAAIEITAATVGAPVPHAVRTWAATVIAIAILGPLGLAILCRQRAILDRLGILTDLLLTDDRAQAQRDYDEIRRRLGGDDGGTLHYIHPKE